MATEYIEKQAAKEAVIDEIIVYPNGTRILNPTAAIYRIQEIPPADVQPVRRGRWVKKNDSPLDGEYCCSNCKQEIDIADGEETPLNRGMNYCPACGADMRGGGT